MWRHKGEGKVKHTCWLMSRIAMSFLSFVNLSKVLSMVEVSVFASTTR